MRLRHSHWVWHEPAMPVTWKERFKEIAKERNQVLWSIDAGGKLIGFAMGSLGFLGQGFSLNHLVIAPDQWRKGFGFDAALALHRYLFDYLDLRRVDAEAYADNVAALRIAERLGYTEYARGHRVFYKAGAFVDHLRLVIEKATWNERWSAEREYAPLAADATR